MNTLQTIERTLGSQRFTAAMKAYAQAFAFRHPTGHDLFTTLSTELREDLTWFFAPAFHQVGAVELAVRDASCRPVHGARGVFGVYKFDGRAGGRVLNNFFNLLFGDTRGNVFTESVAV